MKLAVIVLNWNNTAATIESVRHVAQWQTLKPVVWVVDNASECNDINTVTDMLPSTRLIRNQENLGFAGGNNSAIKEILEDENSDMIMLLNNDAVISESDSLKLIERLKSNRRLIAVGPALHEKDGSREKICFGGRNIAFHSNTRITRTKRACERTSQDPVRYVDYVPGTAILFPADAFRQVGLLDEDYFFSGEIADFCHRAKSLNLLCAIDKNTSAAHSADADGGFRRTLYLYYTLRNRFLFIRKHYRNLGIVLVPYWMCCGFLMAVKALLLGHIDKYRAILLALKDGISGRSGNRNDCFAR